MKSLVLYMFGLPCVGRPMSLHTAAGGEFSEFKALEGPALLLAIPDRSQQGDCVCLVIVHAREGVCLGSEG